MLLYHFLGTVNPLFVLNVDVFAEEIVKSCTIDNQSAFQSLIIEN